MKIKAIAILLMITCSVAFGQTTNDALVLSEDMIDGNARFVGTAGAMGAIGANLSAISINPAGTAVFDKGMLELSGSYFNYLSTSSFLEEDTKVGKAGFNIPNFGVATTLYESSTTPLTKFNFAFSINRQSTYNSKKSFSGQNFNSSITEDMLYEFLNGNNSSTYSGLAWETFVIDTSDYGDTVTMFNYFDDFGKNILQFGEDQVKTITKSGAKREFAFSFGAEFYEKILFGINFSIDQLDYNYRGTHVEKATEYTNPDFEKLEYIEDYSTSGVGYSASIGILVKPIDAISFGGAFHTASTYSIKEEYSFEMYNYRYGYNTNWSSVDGESSYTFQTPYKVNANIAYIFKNIGFIAFDYERIDYGFSNFESSQYDYTQLNGDIDNVYKVVRNFKIGSELRFGAIAFRLGYAIHDNPDANEEFSLGKYKNSISGGIGIKGEHSYFDLAYLRTNNYTDSNHVLYTDYDGALVTGTTHKEVSSKFILSFGVRF